MERFAFKIDKVLKANLYKICRLCGIDNPEKVPIVPNRVAETEVLDADAEPELCEKIKDLIGFTVCKDDKMPQFVCTLCVDKINDFYEFREMCYSTDQQTRKLLGIKAAPKKNTQIKLEFKSEPAPTEKRGKKRKIDEIDNKKDIKEELDNNALPPISKKKKDKLQALGETDKGSSSCINSQLHAWGKKKPRFTEVTDKSETGSSNTAPPTKSNLNTPPLSKKQMRIGNLKQKAHLEPVVTEEIKPEVKDEPFLTEPSASVPPVDAALKLKQVCHICDQRFQTKLKLERHKENSHLPNIPKFFCTTCNEEVVKINDIKSHQLWHKLSKTPYTCGLCGETLLTTNLYTRHLTNHTQRTNILVYDRECSMCHETFVTNFLYNTHACALRTKKCGGCNRKMKSDIEYQLHAPHCEKAYLVASKHIGGAIEAVKIKNENDVEAAAVEDFGRPIDVPLTMMPIVSLTRLPIEPHQRINLASGSSAIVDLVAAEASAKSKKSSKKGISKKDLKRVDDLLKSTINTLVSIKHEPEINVDAEPHATTPQPTSVHNDEPMEQEHDDSALNDVDGDPMQFGDDDFQNQDDDSNHSCMGAAMELDVQRDVKQEPNDDAAQQQPATELNVVRIKREPPDHINEVNEASPSKVPVLKLKITKEHGTLNSSLVNDSREKAEKKKKKKKRKDAEKAAADVANNPQLTETKESTHKVQSEPSMPLPGIVHIKQERMEEDYFEGNVAKTNEPTTHTQPEATIMTSIPMMQFQIACVSSGVEFDHSAANNNELEHTADEAEEQIAKETDQQDVKPNREDLDRLLAANLTQTQQEEQEQQQQQNETPALEAAEIVNTSKQRRHVQKPARKSVATKSTSQRKVTNTKTNTSIEQMPQIVAVSSGIDLTAVNEPNKAFVMPPHVRIKTEPLDDDYYRNVATTAAAIEAQAEEENETAIEQSSVSLPAHVSDKATHEDDDAENEQAYINSIDFTNVRIKQEKDIEVSESQLTTQHFPTVNAFNGVAMEHDEDGSGSAANEHEGDVDDEEEEEDEEDEGDEDEEAEMTSEEEKREYREIDWPPLLPGAADEAVDLPAAIKPSFDLMIANVCSQATELFTKDHEGTKVSDTVAETASLLHDRVEPQISSECVATESLKGVSEVAESELKSMTEEIELENGISSNFPVMDLNTATVEAAFEQSEGAFETEETIKPTQAVFEPRDTLRPTEEALESSAAALGPNEAAFEPTEAALALTKAFHQTKVPLEQNQADMEPVPVAFKPSEAFLGPPDATFEQTKAQEQNKKAFQQTYETLEQNETEFEPTASYPNAIDAETVLENEVASSRLIESNNAAAEVLNDVIAEVSALDCKEQSQSNDLTERTNPAVVSIASENADDNDNSSDNAMEIADSNAAANIDEEEQQNILNHEKFESTTTTTSTTVTDKQLTTNTLPAQLESYLEDISSNSCSIFSSITNENSRNDADTNLEKDGQPQAQPQPTTTTTRAPANYEETENLYNENIDAALNQRQHFDSTTSSQHSQAQLQQQHALLLDNSNVNEIAENNNNANIERELLDDVNNQTIESPSTTTSSPITSPNLPTA